MERWYHGSGGQRIIHENMNVARSTPQSTPQPLESVGETGHYRLENRLRIDELPDHVPSGGNAVVRASATANIPESQTWADLRINPGCAVSAAGG